MTYTNVFMPRAVYCGKYCICSTLLDCNLLQMAEVFK